MLRIRSIKQQPCLLLKSGQLAFMSSYWTRELKIVLRVFSLKSESHKIKTYIIIHFTSISPKHWIVELNCMFNVTINDISVIYVTAHRCAGGLKKKYDLRSGSQRHRHFVGFFNVPVLAPTRDQPFYTVIPTHRPI